MGHEFSVLIHDWISQRLDQAQPAMRAARDNGDTLEEHFQQGQRVELEYWRNYLTRKIDLDTQNYFE